MIASLSDGMPPTWVYLVNPLLIAPMAASLMCCGVSKSGSPAPRLTTSFPSAFIFAAWAVTARVGDGLIAWTRAERRLIEGPGESQSRILPHRRVLTPGTPARPSTHAAQGHAA